MLINTYFTVKWFDHTLCIEISNKKYYYNRYLNCRQQLIMTKIENKMNSKKRSNKFNFFINFLLFRLFLNNFIIITIFLFSSLCCCILIPVLFFPYSPILFPFLHHPIHYLTLTHFNYYTLLQLFL